MVAFHAKACFESSMLNVSANTFVLLRLQLSRMSQTWKLFMSVSYTRKIVQLQRPNALPGARNGYGVACS